MNILIASYCNDREDIIEYLIKKHKDEIYSKIKYEVLLVPSMYNRNNVNLFENIMNILIASYCNDREDIIEYLVNKHKQKIKKIQRAFGGKLPKEVVCSTSIYLKWW
ncbi:hypothetical protein DICPUDRAFT_78258 [Dictyostelium purpureum]|uniref:Uncharacterized protein n=1 Tax=Dictyostelium purpureum TaxID=5786 RepID=F0ZJ14_DICPU|nr:uncharacterized protein DICPUDRAFT_78258 [Dictyostelium purpureum]EGC36090.1 hypothetical protein DICPUDRAFT_78258 [Dictyostelium purpureum]|eukprot:XP_003287408.1 hypothetical protein DICPUDRAFT_78258 [Dictyostelium purpureum]